MKGKCKGGYAMKGTKWLCLLVSFILFLGLVFPAQAAGKHMDYIWGTFDTVVILTAYTDTDQQYAEMLSYVKSEFTRLHRIFDKYHTYEGIHNLCALNEAAPFAPYAPAKELMNLLLQINEWRNVYSKKNDPALGAVLKLWHVAREETLTPPTWEALTAAAAHCAWMNVVMEDGTVFFTDPALSLDLGSVAKGYAAQLVADGLRQMGYDSFIINAGGNVVTGEAPLDGREHWSVGVENPDSPSQIRSLVYVKNLSVITSGDYQRYFESKGVRYHHLIDPDTLFPGQYFRAVTLICDDSGLGDFLSTALFLTPFEEGLALVEGMDGLEAQWTLPDGTIQMSSGFSDFLVQTK